jgi:hypothetical protein
MKKEFSLRELKAKLETALQNYANCGCKIYREEADALQVRIARITGTYRTNRKGD